MPVLPLAAARRYLVRRSGLWPERRFQGREGAAAALHLLGKVQVDPVAILARSHDLTLWNRVEGYRPDHLDALLYADRRFFDYGAHLDIYPMETLPLWRLHMRRRLQDERQTAVRRSYPELIAQVLSRIRDEGPASARDLGGGRRIESYRARHEAGLVLYHLWLTGRLMTHSRRGIERVYDLTERVAPGECQHEPGEWETEDAMARLTASRAALATAGAWRSAFGYAIHRKVSQAEAERRLQDLAAAGLVRRVRVEGVRGELLVPGGDLPMIDALARESGPEEISAAEASFLSPLDNLLDRRQLKDIFHFDYVWEIYKRPQDVRWGRYVTPILLGDRLVGRMSPRFDAGAKRLIVDGVWTDEPDLLASPAFATALARGLLRLAAMLGAERTDISAVGCDSLRRRL